MDIYLFQCLPYMFSISLSFPYMFVSWGLLWNVQAMQGRYLPLAVVYHKDYEHAKRAFLLYHKLFVARGIVYALFMLLPFFEVSSISEYPWNLLARAKLFHKGCGCNFVRPRSSKFLIVSGLASDNWPHFLWHAVIVFAFSRYQLGAMEKCQTRVVIQRYILSAVCRIFSHGYLFWFRYLARQMNALQNNS